MFNKIDQLKSVYNVIDATYLGDEKDNEKALSLCAKSYHVELGYVAAICVYPDNIHTVSKYIRDNNLSIKIATVANFPFGDKNINQALSDVTKCLELGADEVDIVFPYRALIDSDKNTGEMIVSKAKQLCGKKDLKVIIESGELKSQSMIELACKICIDNGADFIKTSTGKVPVNATIDAAKTILNVINSLNKDCGFKASGGIKTVDEALQYVSLATEICGDQWLNSGHFRIGASALIDNIFAQFN